MPALALVVPCYNEAKRFPVARFREFLENNPDSRLILVNDGSLDDTVSVLNGLQTAFPSRVHVLDRKLNRGKAETVREGMLYGLRLPAPPEILGFWDADLATPLEAVSDMLPVLIQKPEIQMVFGARVNLLGRNIRRDPLRHYLGRIFATTVSGVLGLPIYDTQCGAKLFRVTPSLEPICRDAFSTRWVFDVEMIARWIQMNRYDCEHVKRTIYEFPLHNWEDVAGSKVKPYDFFLAFLDVLGIYRRYFLGQSR